MSKHNDAADSFVANNADSFFAEIFKIYCSCFIFNMFVFLFYLNLIRPTLFTLSSKNKQSTCNRSCKLWKIST